MNETEKTRLTGACLEKLVVERSDEYARKKLAMINRCGVQAVRTKDDWIVIPSLPDFQGVTRNGRVFTFDCKVCSQASFDLGPYRKESKGERSRQLDFMLRQSQFNVPCFFLMHWNARSGKTFSEGEETWHFPIHSDHPFWRRFRAGETKSINRGDCHEYGLKVEWTIFDSGRKTRPDFLSGVLDVLMRQEFNG